MKPIDLMSHPLVRRLRRNWLVLVVGGCCLLAMVAGYFAGEGRFGAEWAAKLTEIEKYKTALSDAAAKAKARPELDRKLQSLADQMLGPSLETVDSEVRRRLNRACEELRINDFAVTTGTSLSRLSPAKKEFNTLDVRKMRDEVDFVEVQATVIASGSVSQIYRLLYRIDAEPWMKRIESLRLVPIGDGQSIRATIRLTTPFMPGVSAKQQLVLDPAKLQAADRFAALFASNPFRIPPPPPTPPAAIAAVDQPGAKAGSSSASKPVAEPAVPAVSTGAFPYGEWVVTGVVEGPGGAEAWLRHVPSGAALALQPGTAVGELVFRGVEYDFALFDSPAGACRIQVGTNLTQRSSIAG